MAALLEFSISYFCIIGSLIYHIFVYFDPMHYGHANALRQAKALGDELVVGILIDEESH